MENIEKKLMQLLESGQKVTLNGLGGLMACYNEAEVIARSRLMDEFLSALIDDVIVYDTAEIPLLEELVIRCFSQNNDPIAIKSAVEILCTKPEKLGYCFDALIQRTGDKTNLSLSRGYFLLGAFEIALKQKAKKFNLVSYLVQVDIKDDAEYLKYVAKVVGAGYTAFQIEDLAEKLAEFVTAEVGEDDALYESGMCFLTKGLNSVTQKQANQYFDSALFLFHQAGLYCRHDAKVYTAALETLKGFIDGVELAGIKIKLERLQHALANYVAWETFNPNISWVNLRNSEIVNWYELSDYLTSLVEQFALPAWLEPIVIIERYLLKIYDCSRSIFKKATNGSLELLVKPVIQSKFLEQPERIFLLERWLSASTDTHLLSIGNQLQVEIEDFKRRWLTGNGEGTASKSLADVVPSLIQLPADALTEFEKFVVSYRMDRTTDISLILQKKFDELASGLAAIKTYNHPEIRKEFNTILYHSLRFLELRMDNTAANHPKARYLFENKALPKESALQNDYFEFMQPINLKGKIRLEQMDVGGGRADVYFEYLSFNFCTEVKRDDIDTSFTAIRKKYLGQTKEYQNTTAKLGILLVLDLLPKLHGIGSFESNINLEITSTFSDQEPRGIVVIKVPANRVTPSAVVL